LGSWLHHQFPSSPEFSKDCKCKTIRGNLTHLVNFREEEEEMEEKKEKQACKFLG
jgi:hypothetical protein